MFIGGTVVKSELLRDMMGMGTISRAYTHQRRATNSFYCRQQCARGEVARPQQPDGNRFRGGDGGCFRVPCHFYCDALGLVYKLRISNQDSEKRLLRFPRDEFICRLRLINRKPVRNQSADIHFAIGEELEKSLHITSLRPPKIPNG